MTPDWLATTWKGFTLTATQWTDTPTPTFTPTFTYTPSNTPTFTPTLTYTPNFTETMHYWYTAAAATLTATWWTDTPTPVTRNGDWMPVGTRIGGMEMMLVPAGCFMMGSEDGSDNERPVHQQCFDEPYWIGRYEVTNAQYQQCVRAGACDPPKSGYGTVFYEADHPVVGVSWFNARQYVWWLSDTSDEAFRLPTEAEWEYAARGPDSLVYPWGDDFVADNVVYGGNSDAHTQTVGSKPSGASWIGALDMSGNVWEWTSTIYRDYPYHVTDGREDTGDEDAVRVLRGGSWNLNQDRARAAYRLRSIPDVRIDSVGFRVVRSPSQ